MTKTTILCIGDLHFKDSNVSQTEEFTRKCLELTKKLRPDFVVCLGDVLDMHEKYTEGPFNRAIFFIDALTQICPVFLLIGNHDLINNTQFLSNRHPFNALKKWPNITVVDDVIEYKINASKGENSNQSFVFLPYVPPDRFLEALNGSGIMWENANAIFGHQEIRGVKMGAIVSQESDEWSEGMPLLVSGHIHDEQVVKNGVSTSIEECAYPDVIYTGSAMQHSFGETGKKYVYLFTFDDDSYKYKRYDLGLKLKKQYYFESIEEINKFDVKNCEKYYVKISLTAKTEECQAFRKSEKYKELQELGIRFKFNAVRDEVKHIQNELKKKYGNKNKLYNYTDILRDLVIKEKDSDIKDDYEFITNEKLKEIQNSGESKHTVSKEKPKIISTEKPSVDLKTILKKQDDEKLVVVLGKKNIEFVIVETRKK